MNISDTKQPSQYWEDDQMTTSQDREDNGGNFPSANTFSMLLISRFAKLKSVGAKAVYSYRNLCSRGKRRKLEEEIYFPGIVRDNRLPGSHLRTAL